MRYCSMCGSSVTLRVPGGDNRLRACCDQCGTIHYVNPRPVVGTIPVWGDEILLCRRAIEPRHGKWTLPAGFMEVGETTAGGAMRETLEEAGARIELGPIFSVIDVPHVEQVHIFFQARLLDRTASGDVCWAVNGKRGDESMQWLVTTPIRAAGGSSIVEERSKRVEQGGQR